MLYGQISIDPEIMSGTAVFIGTRVLVQNLVDYIEGGEDLNEFPDDFFFSFIVDGKEVLSSQFGTSSYNGIPCNHVVIKKSLFRNMAFKIFKHKSKVR